MADALTSQQLNFWFTDLNPTGSQALASSGLKRTIPADRGKPEREPTGSVHFLSRTCEWATPQDFFDTLNTEFGFELDVCATPSNAKCERYFTKKDDGLSQPWTGTCWCNPPYGRAIKFWIEKAMRSAQEGEATVVCLVPARTDTNWWHDYVTRASEVRFVKGRLKFGGHKNCAPFPSAVVVFRAEPAARADSLSHAHRDARAHTPRIRRSRHGRA